MEVEQVGLPGIRVEIADADSCYTPQWVLDIALEVMGGIDIDPAWHPDSLVRPIRAGYTVKENGLRQEWRGRVWFQPPYSDMPPWVAKLNLELGRTHTVQAMGLVKLDPSTGWWGDYLRRASAVCLVPRRVRHLGPYAKGKAADFCSAIVGHYVALDDCRRAYPEGYWFDPGDRR